MFEIDLDEIEMRVAIRGKRPEAIERCFPCKARRRHRFMKKLATRLARRLAKKYLDYAPTKKLTQNWEF